MSDNTNLDLKIQRYNVLRQTVHDQIFQLPKYIAIRKIPLIFLGFLIFCLILIHHSVCNPYKLTKPNKKMLNKFTYLIMGLTVAIAHVYLSSLRTEYKQKIYTLWKYKQELEDYDNHYYNPIYI